MNEPGLRERKKARTRAVVQQQALRLFGEQGYQATTMEQIAAAADVSPSTLYRYFTTKEELVHFNAFNDTVTQAFGRQSSELGPVPALRSALREILGEVADGDLELGRQRAALILEMGHQLTAVASGINMLTEMFTPRVAADQPVEETRLLAGAVFGVIAAIWLDWADHPDRDIRTSLDEGLARFER